MISAPLLSDVVASFINEILHLSLSRLLIYGYRNNDFMQKTILENDTTILYDSCDDMS